MNNKYKTLIVHTFKNDKWRNDGMKYPVKLNPYTKTLVRGLWRLGYNTSNLGAFWLILLKLPFEVPNFKKESFEKLFKSLYQADYPREIIEYLKDAFYVLGESRFFVEMKTLIDDYNYLYRLEKNFKFATLYVNKTYEGKEIYNLQNIRRKVLFMGPNHNRYAFLPMFKFSKFVSWEASQGNNVYDAESEHSLEEGYISPKEEKKLNLEEF